MQGRRAGCFVVLDGARGWARLPVGLWWVRKHSRSFGRCLPWCQPCEVLLLVSSTCHLAVACCKGFRSEMWSVKCDRKSLERECWAGGKQTSTLRYHAGSSIHRPPDHPEKKCIREGTNKNQSSRRPQGGARSSTNFLPSTTAAAIAKAALAEEDPAIAFARKTAADARMLAASLARG